MLFIKAGNNQRLACTYVYLEQYSLALEAARKADIPKVWKQVCFACLRAKEFKYATQCGLNVIIHPDHLDDLIAQYERFGYYQELINLMEQGLLVERTHNGVCTELGVLYAKYDTQRLQDHIHQYSGRLNIPMLIRACEQHHLWPEVVQLHQKFDQFDHAIVTMIEHSPTAFKHEDFARNILKVTNYDLYYRAMIFYLEE